MKRTILYIFLIILFFVTSPFAQSDYKIELNGGRISAGIENKLLPNWDTGWSMEITASKQLNNEIELTSSFSFQNFKFQANRIQLVMPAVYPPSYSYSFNGENSKVYNFTIGIRIFPSYGKFSTFISFNSGIQYINQGKIYMIWSNPQLKDPTFLTNSNLYNSSNRNYLVGIFRIGAGLAFNILPKINLITQGRLATTLKEFTFYSILSAGVQYSF